MRRLRDLVGRGPRAAGCAREPRQGLDLRRRLPADAGWRERLRIEERSRWPVPTVLAIAWVRQRAKRRWESDPELRAAARRRMEAVLSHTQRSGEVEALARAAVLEDAAAAELLRRPWRLTDRRRLSGAGNLRGALASGRGVVVSYCHLGPFQGASAAVLAVADRRPWLFLGTWIDQPPGTGLSGRHIERWRRLTDRTGAHALTTTPGTLTRCVELLARGEIVCVLFDVRGSTPTPWLGKPVALATGSARMAHAADALIVPMICHRRRGTAVSHFGPAVDSRHHATPEALHRALAAIHERAVLARPEAFEDPLRFGAWEAGAGPAAWLNPEAPPPSASAR